MSARTDWPLGCQARPWLQTLGREGIVERLPEVMRAIATYGFVGFETRPRSWCVLFSRG